MFFKDEEFQYWSIAGHTLGGRQKLCCVLPRFSCRGCYTGIIIDRKCDQKNMNNSNVYQHVRTMCAGHTTYAQALSEDFAKYLLYLKFIYFAVQKHEVVRII